MSADDKVNKQLEDLDKHLEELKDKDFSKDLIPHLESLKEVINDSGRSVLELKESVSQTMNNFKDSFEEKLIELGKTPSGVEDLSSLPKYLKVEEKNSCYLHKEYYDGLANGYPEYNVDKINLIPFEYLEKLKPFVDYYYKIYTAMDEVFVSINEQHMKELVNFKSGLNVTNEALDLVLDVPVFGYPFKYCKHIALLAGDSINFQNYVKHLSQVYSEPQELLNDFYCETDVDILTFLIEYRVLARTTSDGVHAKKDNKLFFFRTKERLNYHHLIKLIFNNIKDKFVIDYDDEVVKRLAVAFILSKKLLNGELGNILPLRLIPYYKGDSLELDMNSYNYIGKDSAVKYDAFLYTIHLHLFYSILIIEGFDIRFIDRLYRKMIELNTDYSYVELDKDDISNLEFIFDDYKRRISVYNLSLR